MIKKVKRMKTLMIMNITMMMGKLIMMLVMIPLMKMRMPLIMMVTFGPLDNQRQYCSCWPEVKKREIILGWRFL